MEETMVDWSELLPPLLAMISRRLDLIEDFVAFRGVCTSWRAAARKDDFVKWPTVPLLMLAEQKDSEDREFYSPSKGKIWSKFALPEAKNNKCMESRGWFITVEGDSGEMNLLHPFSRVQIQLPNQKTFPDYEINEPGNLYGFVRRAVLSASPSDTSDYVLVVVDTSGAFLGFWRPGDKSWTRIEAFDTKIMPTVLGGYSDVNYYNGKFYAIDYLGRIWDWEVSGPSTARNVLSIDSEFIGGRDSYIVESAGELLVIVRNDYSGLALDGETYGTTGFRVVQLDLIKNQWKELKSLVGRSIFIGHNAAFSVDATSFLGVIKPNCIYFTDDWIDAYYWTDSQRGGGRDMGLYSLENGKVERFGDIQSFSLICPPVWIAPSLQ